MRIFLITILLLSVISLQLWSQVLPVENSKLNYRIIGFSFPSAPAAKKYKLEIALGNYYSTDSFKKNIVYTGNTNSRKIIAEVPSFGEQYTWRVVDGNNAGSDEWHHFNTGKIPAVDTTVTRLRILKNTGKHKDDYVFLDGNRSLYDMNGNPVWYLPDIGGYNTDLSRLRDMKITSRGTITFLYEERAAYEINYNGDILWEMPHRIIKGVQSKGPTHPLAKPGTKPGKPVFNRNLAAESKKDELFHHEFTRLPNGHYMVLGVEDRPWSSVPPSAADTSQAAVAPSKQPTYAFGTVLEYNDKGDLIWSWRSYDYFKNSDLYYHNIHGNPIIAAHENSFYFDERDKVIYVSFRDIGRILKIKYPEGTVLGAWGETFKPGIDENGNGIYCQQHSISKSADGNLYLFNNNNCTNFTGDGLPTILKLKEPASGDDQLSKIWEYQCTIDGVDTNHPPYKFPIGGNVVEMPDHSLLVNMSTTYSKVFILGTDKKILWSAIPEKWDEKTKKWGMIPQYRANIITSRKDLENLVWSTELKR